MDLPAEVRQVSMRVNQRYFAFRNADGSAAPYFGFVANIEPTDGGATSIAGNERVLRARFADARHFWDLDRKARLESRVPLLDHVTFHAKLGSQGERVRRLERLAEEIAPLVGAGPALARDAARLAKADLVTGMVGEFPELQGVMGRYYALHDGEDRLVADAIRDHYAPKRPADAVPTADVSIAVALADKLDLLVGFFAIGERPTGAGDPYALRRAALGIIRIVRENGLRIGLLAAHRDGGAGVPSPRRAPGPGAGGAGLPRRAPARSAAGRGRAPRRAGRGVRRRSGRRHPAPAVAHRRGDRAAGERRRREPADGVSAGRQHPADRGAQGRPARWRADRRPRSRTAEEHDLHRAAADADADITGLLRDDDYETALGVLAKLRSPLDAFFDKVTVNAPEPDLRRNRLRLLHKVRSTMDRIADFSKIEG